MTVSLDTQIVLICRTEVEKTPKTVFAHEVEVLRKIHGERRIELTDAKSPVGKVDVDLSEEYQRLLDEYSLAEGEDGHPVINLFGDVESFVDAVKAPKRGKKAE